MPLPFQRLFTDDPVQVISLKNFYNPSSTQPHRHNFYMLVWITKGTGLHRINFREYELYTNQVYLLHDGAMHQVINYPKDGWMILFKPSVYESFLAQHPNKQNVGLCDAGNRKPFTILTKTAAKAFQMILRLIQQELNTSPQSQLLSHYVSLLLFHANRQEPRDQTIHYSTETIQMQRLRQLINQHYKVHRRAKFYGEHLGISARKLNGISKKITGRLVQDLVAEKLLSESEALLATTNKRVKEIIYELGFIDHAHFAYFFKQYKGTTPSDYRKRLQG